MELKALMKPFTSELQKKLKQLQQNHFVCYKCTTMHLNAHRFSNFPGPAPYLLNAGVGNTLKDKIAPQSRPLLRPKLCYAVTFQFPPVTFFQFVNPVISLPRFYFLQTVSSWH